MSWAEDTILELSKQLYPEGRAFKMPAGGTFNKLHKALAKSEGKAYNDAVAILNDILPDNALFTVEDARQWERRLGIIANESTPLADRKMAIRQKMAYPGSTAPRCSAEYITEQLQAAGFNVKVYENIFLPGPVTMTPGEILGITTGDSELAMFELGEVELGEGWSDSGITIIANHLEEDVDASFAIPPDNYRSTFFIGNPDGLTPSPFVDVPLARKDEFRQLILQLKPQQTVGFMFVNYI